MIGKRLTISVIGAAALVSALLAISAIWLVLTEPTAVVAALEEGTVTPAVRELAAALAAAFRALIAYL
jgi:hypothetical protein